MVTAAPASLLQPFLQLEARLAKEPETVQAEIVLGTYLMSPRPRARHGGVQGRLFAVLHERLGLPRGSEPPDWLFVIEPEIRSEKSFSRVVPDVAGWRRSTSGWPDLDETPIALVPEWVGEVLSPSTAAIDRGVKAEAYGRWASAGFGSSTPTPVASRSSPMSAAAWSLARPSSAVRRS